MPAAASMAAECQRWPGDSAVWWAKLRAVAAARLRGSSVHLCQAGRDRAVTHSGTMAHIDDAVRQRFLVAKQLAIAARERGLLQKRRRRIMTAARSTHGRPASSANSAMLPGPR